MSAKNGGRSHGTDFASEAGLDGRCFSLAWHHGEDFFGLQDLAYGHTDGTRRDLIQTAEPPFRDLLLPAGLVEADGDVGLLGVEVRRRIVECNMAVFTDTDEGDVNRLRANRLACAPGYVCRI